MFPEAEEERLRGFPEIGSDGMISAKRLLPVVRAAG